MIDQVMQIGLAVFGLATIAIVAVGRPPFTFVGCSVGVFSEVFWFYTATHPWQPGLFVLAIAYTIVYVLGVITHRPRRRRQQ